jgi:hypothetical protein
MPVIARCLPVKWKSSVGMQISLTLATTAEWLGLKKADSNE